MAAEIAATRETRKRFQKSKNPHHPPENDPRRMTAPVR
jgi:hypothetical protein